VQTVASGSHKTGQGLVKEVTSFTAPTPPSELIDALVREVNAYQQAPTVVPGLYLASRSGDGVVFCFGSKISDVFTAQATVGSDRNGGARGSYEIMKWTVSEGLVDRRDDMTRLRSRIQAGVASVGGTSSTNPPAP
jgi:hypothetical protein